MSASGSAPPVRRHRHEAMATWFELHVAHADADYVGQAALEAFALVDRLENSLSRFREESEVSRLGRLQPGESLRLSPETFACLRIALDLHGVTCGAFDPALGQWSDHADARAIETPARGRLVLFPGETTVQCEGGPVRLDLGAIGKGFALDQVATLLGEWELPNALLIAGGSSLLALDGPAPGQEWEVTLTRRQSIWITNTAVGASGASVKGAHIRDPRTGEPRHGYARTWAVAPSAATADALSTAWMLLDRCAINDVCRCHADIGAALLADEARAEAIECLGAFPEPIYGAAG